MIALAFALAAVLIVTAVVLLVVDWQRQSATSGFNRRRARKQWARGRNAEYWRLDRELGANWQRTPAGDARAVVSGFAYGREMHVCDINGVTIIALRRSLASEEVFALSRSADSELPVVAKESGLYVTATNPQVVHRIFDDRATEMLQSVPECVHAMWSENEWSIAELGVDSRAEDWEKALDSLAVFSDIARRFPPAESEIPTVDETNWDPTRAQLGIGFSVESGPARLQPLASLSEETQPASAIDVEEISGDAVTKTDDAEIKEAGTVSESHWRPERGVTLDPDELPSRTVSRKMGATDSSEAAEHCVEEESRADSEIPALGEDPEHSRMKVRGGRIIRPNEKPSSIFSDSEE